MYDYQVNMKKLEGQLAGGVSFECTEDSCNNHIYLPIGLKGEKTCSECYTTYDEYDILETLNRKFNSYEDVIDGKDDEIFELKNKFNRGKISKKDINKKLKNFYNKNSTKDAVSSFSHALSSGFRYKEGKPTITMHTSGSFTVMGIKTTDEALNILNNFLSKTGLYMDSDLECSNMNISGDLDMNIDLDSMYFKMSSNPSFVDVTYESESYPSLRCRIRTSEDSSQFIQFYSTGTFTLFTTSEDIFEEMMDTVTTFIDEEGYMDDNNILRFNNSEFNKEQSTLTDFKREQIEKELASLNE